MKLQSRVLSIESRVGAVDKDPALMSLPELVARVKALAFEMAAAGQAPDPELQSTIDGLDAFMART